MMYIKLFIKEWRENLLVFFLAVMLMLALAGLSLTDQKTLTLYFAGMFLWLFLPFAGMLIGSGAFYSEFKDNAWIYLFSRPIRKEIVWVIKYLAGLSMLLFMYLVFSGLMHFMPGMFVFFQDITPDSSLTSPLIMIMALSISFSLSFLHDKQFIIIFISIIISIALAFLFQQYQVFLFNKFYFYGDLKGFPILVALSFMAASLVTFIRIDFSQAGTKVFHFTKLAILFLILSFFLSTAWVVKEKGFSGQRPYAWYRSAEYKNFVYFQTYDNAFIRYNSETGNVETVDQSTGFSFKQFSVKRGKIAFFQRKITRKLIYEDLWIMNTDGTEKKMLIESSSKGSPFHGFINWESILSEDGKRLAFSANSLSSNKKNKIWIMNSDGTDIKEFPLDHSIKKDYSMLAWQESENCLLLRSGIELNSPVLIKYNLEKKVSESLLENTRWPEIIIRGVSPKGNYILFNSRFEDNGFVLSLLDIRTREKKDIHASGSLALWKYSWNSNEDKVAFFKNNEFWLYDISKDNLVELQTWPHKFGINFDWIENENKLVVNDFLDGKYNIQILNLDLKEEKRIVLPKEINNPHQIWGLQNCILIKNYRQGNLWRLDLETEELSKIY